MNLKDNIDVVPHAVDPGFLIAVPNHLARGLNEGRAVSNDEGLQRVVSHVARKHRDRKREYLICAR